MSQEIYSPSFFQNKELSVSRSAQIMVPLIIDLFGPQSVVDFGCGTGVWLSVFKDHGIKEILGLDGNWVDVQDLKIDRDQFVQCDLEAPPPIGRHFDLAISLEVGEHLSANSATTFVRAITEASDIVVFSAATPYQGGSRHINEQWPEYWAQIFEEQRFKVLDPLRDLVWWNLEIEPHYAQNTLVYVREARFADYVDMQKPTVDADGRPQLRKIHPRLWESKMEEALDFSRFGTGRLIKSLPKSIMRSLNARFTNSFGGNLPR
jgi:SAM-dependent methyltransferase